MTRRTPLRAGLLGLGRIAREGHFPAYQANADLVTVVACHDPDERQRVRAAELLGVPYDSCHATLTDLLAGHDLDVVVVASPPDAHHTGVRRVLEHGVPVICEKPLCVNRNELDSIEATAGRTGGFVAVVHNYLYQPGWRLLIELVRSGRIGTPVMARFEEFSDDHWREPGGPAHTWRERIDAGGGPLRDNLYHAVYLAEEILGGPVTEATGVQAALVHPYPSGDLAAMTARHANGTLTQATAAWCHRGTARGDAEILGTDGTMRYHYWSEPDRIYVDDGAAVEPITVTGDPDFGYSALFRDIFTRLRDGAPPRYGIADAARILRAIDSIGADVGRRADPALARS